MTVLLKNPEKQIFIDMFSEIDEHWNEGDRSKYLDSYDDDSIYMPPNQDAIHGYAGIENFVKNFPDVKIEHELVSIWGEEDAANVHGKFRIKDHNGDMMDKGKFLAFYQKNSTGDWKITHALWNSDIPLEV